MFGAAFVPLPVHGGRLLIKDLNPVHAHVSLVTLRIAGDYLHEGDVAAAIIGPTLQYGQDVQRNVVEVDNLFLIKQAGLFLFCLGLFYMVPIRDLVNKHRIVDLIIVTKVLAVLFLITNAWLVAKPGPILLAALGDGIMGTLLIFCSLTAGLFLKKESPSQA